MLELRQSGGIANLARKIIIEGDRLSVANQRRVTVRRDLAPQEGKAIRKLVEKLKGVRPKNCYGREVTSDAMRSVLAISENRQRTIIEVQPDPSDPPPQEYNAILEFLWRLIASLG